MYKIINPKQRISLIFISSKLLTTLLKAQTQFSFPHHTVREQKYPKP